VGYLTRYVVLSLLSVAAMAETTLKPGDMVPDFTMPATNGFGQRLEEARGSFLMVVWLGRCDGCSETLVRYQLLAESLAIEGLKGWFVWTPSGKSVPPNMRLPVLRYEEKWRQSWQFEERPAVMLINADGRLDHLITGDLKENYQETEQVVMRWMSQGRDYQVPE